MDDEERLDPKVINFVSSKGIETPMQLLRSVADEISEYPAKHAYVILMDEDGEVSFWGTKVSKEQLCRMKVEFEMHAYDELIGPGVEI